MANTEQLEINIEIERHVDDKYTEALSEYLLKKDGRNTFLCYNKVSKQYYVNWLFSREYLEFKKIIIVR